MATKKGFAELDSFKKLLLSKEKFDVEEISELLKLYIESVWFYHFKLKLKWKAADDLIDTKLKWIYEMDASMKVIINEAASKPAKSN